MATKSPAITSGRDVTLAVLEAAELVWDKHFKDHEKISWREFFERLADEHEAYRIEYRSCAATKVEKHLRPLMRMLAW